MTDITIHVLSVGTQPYDRTFTFQQHLRVTNQLVSRFNASVAFRLNDLAPWTTWRVEPTPQPQAQFAPPPDNGDSELTVTITAAGTNSFTVSYPYQCQHVEFQEVTGVDKTLNFVLRGDSWWKWRLFQ
jgi:hypothetical protein